MIMIIKIGNTGSEWRNKIQTSKEHWSNGDRCFDVKFIIILFDLLVGKALMIRQQAGDLCGPHVGSLAA